MLADLELRRTGVAELEPPPFGAWTVFRRQWPHAISFFALVYLLMEGLSVPRAAISAIFITIGVGVCLQITQGVQAGQSVATIGKDILARINRAFTEAGALSALMMGIAGALGILIGMVELSGFGFQVSSGVIALTGGSLFVTFLATGILCFILGCGVTVTPLYILTGHFDCAGAYQSGR